MDVGLFQVVELIVVGRHGILVPVCSPTLYGTYGFPVPVHFRKAWGLQHGCHVSRAVECCSRYVDGSRYHLVVSLVDFSCQSFNLVHGLQVFHSGYHFFADKGFKGIELRGAGKLLVTVISGTHEFDVVIGNQGIESGGGFSGILSCRDSLVQRFHMFAIRFLRQACGYCFPGRRNGFS